MTMPEEIVKALKDLWYLFLKTRNYPHEEVTDAQIVRLEKDIRDGAGGYDVLFALSEDIFGETSEEKIKKWKDIVRGDYASYFQRVPKVQKIVVNDQIFMI